MKLFSRLRSVVQRHDDAEDRLLLQRVKETMPTVDAGKAELSRWCTSGTSKSTLLRDHPTLQQPLVAAISGAAWSHWLQLCEAETIDPLLTRQSMLNFLALCIVWSVAAAERAFTYVGMEHGELEEGIGDAVIADVLDRLHRELPDAEPDTEEFVRASVELLGDVYATALAAPSIDEEDQPANALMAQTLEQLGPDPTVADVLDTELRRTWRLMNLSALLVVYRAVGESLERQDVPMAAD